MRLVAACERGHTTVAKVLRKLEAAGPSLELYRALQEVGRIEKTVYLLAFLTTPDLRRQVTYQLNKNESYHTSSLATPAGAHILTTQFGLGTRNISEKKVGCFLLLLLWYPGTVKTGQPDFPVSKGARPASHSR